MQLPAPGPLARSSAGPLVGWSVRLLGRLGMRVTDFWGRAGEETADRR